MKNKKVKMWFKYIFSTLGLIVSLVVIGFAGYYLYNVLTDYHHEETYTKYEVTNDINYQVYMNDNGYIPDKYLDMNRSYITKLVKKIHTDFNFEYSNDDEVEVSYQYKIKGVLTGNYLSQSGSTEATEVWTEDIVNETSKVATVDKVNFKVNDEMDIDMATLNARVQSFQEDMGIAVQGNYQVKMEVTLTFKDGKEATTKTHITTIDIPLNQEVFSVSKTSQNNEIINVANKKAAAEIDKELLILAVSLLVLAIISIIYLLRYGYAEAKSNYEIELEEIFKLYGDRIVTVENIVRKDDSEFIDLIGFEEMIELVNELNLPILCWTSERHKETWFCAIKGNIIYRYSIMG